MVTYATFFCLMALSLFSLSWVVWTLLLGLMLRFFGADHPRTYDEDMPLDTGRLYLAGFAVVMFVLCFTPVPVSVDWPALFRALRGV
jgi:hypothetical protein